MVVSKGMFDPLRMSTSKERNNVVNLRAPGHASIATRPIGLDFEAFYSANIERLTRSLTATLGSRVAAQDAAQDAMVKAYRQWDEIADYSNPMGWCYRVALRRGRRSWRKFSREELSSTFSPGTAASQEEGLRPELVNALLALPLTQRSVIVLRVFMGWTIEETAEALDISPSTASGRYQRGMEALRRSIEGTATYGTPNGGGAQ